MRVWDRPQVCTQKKSKAVFNMNWMTASLQSGDILYTFEKEDMLLSKVKLITFFSVFLSTHETL